MRAEQLSVDVVLDGAVVDGQHLVSTQWAERRSQQGLPVTRVRFSPADCRPCPHLHDCVNSPSPRSR
ncbi:hypothetical protein ACWC9U_25575, partial [Streptomyces sp. 900116325]